MLLFGEISHSFNAVFYVAQVRRNMSQHFLIVDDVLDVTDILVNHHVLRLVIFVKLFR